MHLMSDAFSLPMRVYYEDTDAAGVVYHAAYIRFFERARTEFLRRVGFNHKQLQNEWRVLFAVRSLAVEYERPAYLDDTLDISAEICGGGRVYADFSQTATKDGEIIARAKVRVVCVAGEPLRVAAIPQPLLAQITQSTQSTQITQAQTAQSHVG